MSNDLAQTLERAIPLAEMIQSLRNELLVSLYDSRDSRLKFQVESIDLELQVKIVKEYKGTAGIKFWVLEAGADIKRGDESVHTFKLKLKPQLDGAEASKGALLVSDQVDANAMGAALPSAPPARLPK